MNKAVNSRMTLGSILIGASLMLSSSAFATEMVTPSPAGGLAKVVVGLLVVLAVIAGVAWLIKQLAVGKTGSYSVARIVGGVSVGTRERVVVVEIGDRWIVVGVAPGHVSGIATLEAGSQLSEIEPATNPLTDTTFAKWLKKAVQKNTAQ